MNGLTTITTKGQVTIPMSVRELLNAQVGDKVAFTQVDEEKKEATIKVISKIVVNELAGSLASPIKEVDITKVRQKAGKLLGKRYQIT